MAITTVTKNISLNVSQPNNFELLCAMQTDNMAFKIIATLYDNNQLYTVNGDQIYLRGENPIGDPISREVDSHSINTITFTLSGDLLAYDGLLRLILVMTSGDNQISTFPFIIKIVRSPWVTAMGNRNGSGSSGTGYGCERNSSSVLKYSTTITANGNQTVYMINHNLGTEDVIIQIDNGETQVFVDWEVVDRNNVRLSFNDPLNDEDNYNLIIYGIMVNSTNNNGNYSNDDIQSLRDEIEGLRQSFQDGVEIIYNRCVSEGSTPSDNSPNAISDAIGNIRNNFPTSEHFPGFFYSYVENGGQFYTGVNNNYSNMFGRRNIQKSAIELPNSSTSYGKVTIISNRNIPVRQDVKKFFYQYLDFFCNIRVSSSGHYSKITFGITNDYSSDSLSNCIKTTIILDSSANSPYDNTTNFEPIIFRCLPNEILENCDSGGSYTSSYFNTEYQCVGNSLVDCSNHEALSDAYPFISMEGYGCYLQVLGIFAFGQL